jgi:hypothetical protein
MKRIIFALLLPIYCTQLFAQTISEDSTDPNLPLKLEHAEPLYIDLIRDLGARRGEKEWNVGMGLTDKLNVDEYELLVEYEWAPVNRLGLEVEVPVTIYSPNSKLGNVLKPSNRVESLKTAFQYTFLVSERMQTSMAFGYINELVLTDLNEISARNLLTGNIFNPFLIAAKRLGSNFHSLLYTGPRIERIFGSRDVHSSFEVNSNVHYMLPNSRNFIGIEVNKVLERNNFDMVIRPQMRVSIQDNLLLGLVTGIPVSKRHERLSTFIRLIYEPGHRH